MANDIVCVSGGFDPLHIGHLTLFEAASRYGPVIVILNSDTWLIEKKGYRVMNWQDRAQILRSLRCIADVIAVDDQDRTITEALRRLRPRYFAKSGDRIPESMPPSELTTCQELGIEILYNVCPHLPYSSSQIVAHAKSQREITWRPWGNYEVLDEFTHPHPPHWKVKRLTLAPGQKTSYQRHQDRDEHWIVVRGTLDLRLELSGVYTANVQYGIGQYVHIPAHTWHQIINLDPTLPLVLIEVQMGRRCEEGDIEREGEVRAEQQEIDFLSLSHRLSDA